MLSKDKKIIGYEPVFAMHCPNPDDPANDLHTIKAHAHFEDNTTSPVLLQIRGFRRPYFITKKKYQDYEEKKTYEHLDRLDKFECTQTQLPFEVARKLGVKTQCPNLRELGNSPYLYGTDILSTSLLIHKLKEKYKDLTPTKRTIAVMDSEWSMETGTLTIVTVSIKDKWFIAVNKCIVSGWADPLGEFYKAAGKYLAKTMEERGIKSVYDIEVHFCDTEWDILVHASNFLHANKPDFVGFWNIKNDILKYQEVAERSGNDLGSIFSDPSVPDEFKFFKFKEGRDTHVAKSERKMTLPPDKQWHTVLCPSSFYFICMMSTYTAVRKGQSKVKMSLDACLYRHLKRTKFKFPPADNSALHWHIVMERNHPFVYMCYALEDVVGPELLEEKNGDVTVSAVALAGYSDMMNFTSNPKILVDDLTISFAKDKLIISSSPKERYDPFKGRTIDQRCNIVTLDTSLRTRQGYRCIEELPFFYTNIYLFTIDTDVTTAYPGNQIISNLCMETTFREVMSVHGLPEQIKREVFINLAASCRNNALEITQTAMKAPKLIDLLSVFKEEHNLI